MVSVVFRWLYWWKSCHNSLGEKINFILHHSNKNFSLLFLMFKLLIFLQIFGCWRCQSFLIFFFCKTARSGDQKQIKTRRIWNCFLEGFWIMQNLLFMIITTANHDTIIPHITVRKIQKELLSLTPLYYTFNIGEHGSSDICIWEPCFCYSSLHNPNHYHFKDL